MSEPAAVIVAHPDDETLWAGGTILMHPEYSWEIFALCRRNDPDRAPRFKQALEHYQAQGDLGDLDDSPEQEPVEQAEIFKVLDELLPKRSYKLVLTHGPQGEYTRHLRHEEISRAVLQLWQDKKLNTEELWLFAYEDGQKEHLPRPIHWADHYTILPENIWREKYALITDTYNFAKDSFEAKTTPKGEAFWCLSKPEDLKKLKHHGLTYVD